MNAETSKLLAIIFLTISVFVYIGGIKMAFTHDSKKSKTFSQILMGFSCITLLLASIFSLVYKKSKVNYNDALNFVIVVLTLYVILSFSFYNETKIHFISFLILILISIISCLQMILNL